MPTETTSIRSVTSAMRVALIALLLLVAGLEASYSEGQARPTEQVASSLDPVSQSNWFVPLEGRVLDTRSPLAQLDGGVPRTISITGSSSTLGIPPSTSVAAVSITLTTLAPASNGYLNATADGTSFPANVSYLNYTAGLKQSNSAIVPVGATGKIKIQASSGTHALVDVNGYYTSSPGGSGFAALTPTRAVDSRSGLGMPSQQPGMVTGGTSVPLSLTAVGVPAGARSAVVNFAVINPASGGNFKAYATGAAAPDTAYAFPAGGVTSVGAVVPLNSNGSVTLALGTSTDAHVVVDVMGYFTATDGGGGFTSLQGRVADTRTPTPGNPIQPNDTREIDISSAAVPWIDVSAAVVHITVVAAGPAGYVTAWRSGDSEPSVNSMQYQAASTTSNTLVVQVSKNEKFSIRNHGSQAISLIVDIEGWFSLPPVAHVGPGAYHSVTPQQVTPAAGQSIAAGQTFTGSVIGSAITSSTVDSADVFSALVIVKGFPTNGGNVNISYGGNGRKYDTPITFGVGDDPTKGVGKMVAVLAPLGTFTIKNNSSGSVNVSVLIRGWYEYTGEADADPELPTTDDPTVTIGDESQLEVVPAPGLDGPNCVPQAVQSGSTVAGEFTVCVNDVTEDLPADFSSRLAATAALHGLPRGADTSALESDSDWASTSKPHYGYCFDKVGSYEPSDANWSVKRYSQCSARKFEFIFYYQQHKIGTKEYTAEREIALARNSLTVHQQVYLYETGCDEVEGADDGSTYQSLCNWYSNFNVVGGCKDETCTPDGPYGIFVPGHDGEHQDRADLSGVPMAEGDNTGLANTAVSLSAGCSSGCESSYQLRMSLKFVGLVTKQGGSVSVQDNSYNVLLGDSPFIRCDSYSYFNMRPGCVSRYFNPKLVFSSTDNSIRESVAHIRHVIDADYSLRFLHRTGPSNRARNRRHACHKFEGSQSCDEYPFATTHEGCYVSGNCDIADILLSDNRKSGNQLGVFYQRARVKRVETPTSDAFVVEID